MEEVVQELFEQGVLLRDNAGGVSWSGTLMTQVQLPTTVQGVLAARIDRLATDEKALLQHLAVIGREFAFGLARQVVDHPEARLHQLLDALQRKEFLYEQPAFPEVQYVFKHALTQDVAYQSLLQETRKGIHERTAQAIERTYRQELEDHYSDLAHHYSRSDNFDKAVEYLELAGVQAANRAAIADAVTALSRALECLAQTPETEAREPTELRLQLTLLGPLHMSQGMTSEGIVRLCTRARELCTRVGTPMDLVRVFGELRIYYSVRGDCRTALEYSNELLALSVRVPDRNIEMHAHAALTISHFYLGNLDQVPVHARRVRELDDPAHDRTQTHTDGYDPLGLAVGYEAQTQWLLGFSEQASAGVRENMDLAALISHPFIDGYARIISAMLCVMRREVQQCQREAAAIIALAEEHGFPDWLGWAMVLQGWALEIQGDQHGLMQIEHGITAFQSAKAEVGLPFFHILQAEALLQRGSPAAARMAIEEDLEMAARNHEQVYEAELNRVLGDIDLRENGGTDDAVRIAEAHYHTARTIARAQGAKAWELRAATSLAKLWIPQDRKAEADALLSPIYASFTEGFEKPDLQEAQALLAR